VGHLAGSNRLHSIPLAGRRVDALGYKAKSKPAMTLVIRFCAKTLPQSTFHLWPRAWRSGHRFGYCRRH